MWHARMESLTNDAAITKEVSEEAVDQVSLLSTHQQRGCYWSFNNPPNSHIVCVIPATVITVKSNLLLL